MTSRLNGARRVLARSLAWQSKTALVVVGAVPPLLAIDRALGGRLLGS